MQEYVFTVIKRHIKDDGIYPIFGSQTQAFGTWRGLWTFNQSIWAPRAEFFFFLPQSHRRVSISQKMLTQPHPSSLTWNNILNDPTPWSRKIPARTPPLGEGALTLLTNPPYILCASFCEKNISYRLTSWMRGLEAGEEDYSIKGWNIVSSCIIWARTLELSTVGFFWVQRFPPLLSPWSSPALYPPFLKGVEWSQRWVTAFNTSDF